MKPRQDWPRMSTEPRHPTEAAAEERPRSRRQPARDHSSSPPHGFGRSTRADGGGDDNEWADDRADVAPPSGTPLDEP